MQDAARVRRCAERAQRDAEGVWREQGRVACVSVLLALCVCTSWTSSTKESGSALQFAVMAMVATSKACAWICTDTHASKDVYRVTPCALFFPFSYPPSSGFSYLNQVCYQELDTFDRLHTFIRQNRCRGLNIKTITHYRKDNRLDEDLDVVWTRTSYCNRTTRLYFGQAEMAVKKEKTRQQHGMHTSACKRRVSGCHRVLGCGCSSMVGGGG